MLWVTWEQVGVDRMGCAWLIRRFLDPEASFAFVPPGSTRLPEGAEPFDVPGTRLSHRDGHSTFHTLLEEHAMGDPLLRRIARIVDEADTLQEVMIEPVAPGLDLLCSGIQVISADDQEALTRGAMLFEALYATLAREESQAIGRSTR